MLNLELAQLLIDVARAGSLSAVAQQRYLSKTTVKNQIDELEREVGVALLQRSTRGVVLTAAGKTFVEGAANLIGEAAKLYEACAAASAHEGRRRLRVAYYKDFVFPIVQYCCDRFQTMAPDIDIELVRTEFDNAYTGLRQNQFDFAFCPRPLPQESAGLSSAVTYTTRVCAMVAGSSPLAHKRALTREDLAAHEVAIHSIWYTHEAIEAWSKAADPRFDVRADGGVDAMQEVCSRGGIYLFCESDAALFPYTTVPIENAPLLTSNMVYRTSCVEAAEMVRCTQAYLADYMDPEDMRLLVDLRTRPESQWREK